MPGYRPRTRWAHKAMRAPLTPASVRVRVNADVSGLAGIERVRHEDENHMRRTEVDLCGLGRSKAQAHGHVGGPLAARLTKHAHHGRVAAGKDVLALEGNVDSATLHASVEPALDTTAWCGLTLEMVELATRRPCPSSAMIAASSGTSDAASSRLCCRASEHDSPGLSRAIELVRMPPRVLGAGAQAHGHLSALIHLECPVSHGACLLSKKPGR